jgi:uncharacterized lipoprotein YddW (UPF0748 family)
LTAPRRFPLPLRSLLLAGLSAALVLAGRAPQAQESALPRAARVPVPKEVRGVWVVRTDLTSPAAVDRIVRHAKKNGLNTLFVQVRGRGDAYHLSDLEPRPPKLEGRPDFDPLALAVERGHAGGLQVHAWVNSCYVWSEKTAPESSAHLVNLHPDWLAVNGAGRRCRPGDAEVFICPGNPAARAHLVEICRDIARRYEVDGIQLDYIRYSGVGYCYCVGCVSRFEKSLAGKADPAKVAALKRKGRTGLAKGYAWSWSRFRCEQVTSLVREIRAAVKAEQPGVIVSAAVIPWGAYSSDFRRTEAYRLVAQDWYGWIRSGLVDAVCPMTYQTGAAPFRQWVNGVRRDHPRFPVWFGIGAYLVPSQRAAAKVEAVRQAGGKGWVLFSYTSVTRSGTNDAYLRNLKSRVITTETAGAE